MNLDGQLKEPLVPEQTNDMEIIREQLIALFKLKGKSKKDRARNRILITWMGTLLILVQFIAALTKIIKCP